MGEEPTKTNRYVSELNKCLGKEVIVETSFKKKFKGILLGYNDVHLNVILMTEKEKQIIRNVTNISRRREMAWQEGER